jgi:peroxiredoxin
VQDANAGFVLWAGRDDPGPSVVGWLDSIAPGQGLSLLAIGAALVLLAIQTSALLRLRRENSRLSGRIDAIERALEAGGVRPITEPDPDERSGLAIGALAPAFELPDLSGKAWTLDDLLAAGTPAMLIFVDPECDACEALVPEIGRWQRDYQGITIAVITRKGAERARFEENGVVPVLVEEDVEVATAYEVQVTPTAVIVGPDGLIASHSARGPDRTRTLLSRTLGAPVPTFMPVSEVEESPEELEPLPEGEPAPGFKLPGLGGEIVDFEDFRGRPAILLFWHPDCPFCARILGVVKLWEARQDAASPRLLVLSGGTVKANEALGFRSTVALDEDHAVGQLFGVNGTPSAVLVSASGTIASPLAVGIEEVLSLVGFKKAVTTAAEQ